jgi:hypothetical protein
LQGCSVGTNAFSLSFSYAISSTVSETITYAEQTWQGKDVEIIVLETLVRFTVEGEEVYSSAKQAIEYGGLDYDNYLGCGRSFNTVPSSAITGTMKYFEHVGLYRYNLQELIGNILYNSLSDNYHATIITDDIVAMRNSFNDSEPHALTVGCSVWSDGVNYLIAPIGATVTEVGYSKVGDFAAGSGIIKGLLNTYQGIKYLDWETNEKTFTEIKTLEGVIAPEADVYIENEGNCIKNWANIKKDSQFYPIVSPSLDFSSEYNSQYSPLIF